MLALGDLNSSTEQLYNCKLIFMLILPKQDNYLPVASRSTPFAHLYVHMSVFVKLYLVLYTAACQSNTFSPVYTQLCISVYICWVMVCIIKCALFLTMCISVPVTCESSCALLSSGDITGHVSRLSDDDTALMKCTLSNDAGDCCSSLFIYS